MSRFTRILFIRMLCFGGVLAAAPRAARCDDAQQITEELKTLHQAVHEQSRRIDSLLLQVGKLTQIIEAKNGGNTVAQSDDPPKPAAEPVPEAPKAEAVPKAELVAGVGKHTVARGETLTSIAKHYNISLAELQKANKIENERKLQIGQILYIPAPKSPEPPPEKKE